MTVYDVKGYGVQSHSGHTECIVAEDISHLYMIWTDKFPGHRIQSIDVHMENVIVGTPIKLPNKVTLVLQA